MNSLRNLIREIHRRSLWQVLGIYLVTSWVAYQVILSLTDGLGLPAWVPPLAIVLFIIGLPIVLATAFVQEGPPTAQRSAGPETQTVRAEDSASPSRPARRILTWKRAFVTGAIAFGTLAAAAGGFMLSRTLGIGPAATLVAQGVLSEQDRVVLADFDSPPGDSALGRVVAEALRIDLMQSSTVRLAESAQLSPALQRMQLASATRLTGNVARELAEREGLKAVIAGEVSALGGGYVLSARLLTPVDGATLAAFREVARDSTQLIDAVDRLSRHIREKIGESLRSVRAGAPLADVSTASLAALKKYSQAHDTWQREGDAARAVALYEEAIELDSTFAMAYRSLGTVLGNMDISRQRRVQALTRAYEFRNRLIERERYLAIAAYHSGVTGDNDKVIDAYRSVLELEPDNFIALNNMGIAYLIRRDPQKALELYERAYKVDAKPSVLVNLVETYYAVNRPADAQRTNAEALSRYPDNFVFQVMAFQLSTADRDYTRADSMLRSVDPRKAQVSEVRRFVLQGDAHVRGVRGRVAEAEAKLRELQREMRAAGLHAEALEIETAFAALLLHARRDTARAVRLLDAALAGNNITALGTADRPYLEFAELYAMSGQLRPALDLVSRYEREVPADQRGVNKSYLHTIRALLASLQKDHNTALAEERMAATLDPCELCSHGGLALIFDRAAQIDSAIFHYEAFLNLRTLDRLWADFIFLAPVLERLAQLHDQQGNVQQAMSYYARFVELWKNADPELQPRVRAAHERLSALNTRSG